MSLIKMSLEQNMNFLGIDLATQTITSQMIERKPAQSYLNHFFSNNSVCLWEASIQFEVEFFHSLE